MLENCLSGSEGGGAIALPTPIMTSWTLHGWSAERPRQGIIQPSLNAPENNVG
jgi:hypothetical protein